MHEDVRPRVRFKSGGSDETVPPRLIALSAVPYRGAVDAAEPLGAASVVLVSARRRPVAAAATPRPRAGAISLRLPPARPRTRPRPRPRRPGVAHQERHRALLSLGGEPSQLASARARAEAASCTIREQVPGATRVLVDVARVEPRTKACFDLDPAHRWRPFSPVDGGPRHGPAVLVSAARHVAVYDVEACDGHLGSQAVGRRVVLGNSCLLTR